MKKNILPIALLSALAIILVVGAVAQQKASETAIDPVCGMTVAKANAKATYDYKGTTYYFCNPGCKDAFMKEPEKYLKAQPEKAGEAKAPAPMGQMGMMHHGQGMVPEMGKGMANCPMMHGGQMGGKMMAGYMAKCGHMGMRGPGLMAPGMGRLMMLYGDKIEAAVENTKDGAALKIASKDPEVVKAIQVHMAEHITMMKKMKDAAAKLPEGADKMPEGACCANCGMMKK